MNKEQQIEEMAIGLEEEFVLCGTLSSCGTKRCSRCFSKYLYEQGYRKLPEDSILFSREEYEKLQETISDLKYDKFDLKNEISEKDNKIALLEGTIDCIKFNVGFARKETAEKIFNDIFALVNNAKDKSSKIFGNSSDYGKGYKNSVNHFNEHILELAKQFGLEIKE